MKIKDLRLDFVNTLSELYDSDEVLSFFYILSEKFLGLRRVDIALALDTIVADKELENFVDATMQLTSHRPIQYITGDTLFYGLPFIVDPHVLIPRPETEELVDWIIKDCMNLVTKKRIKILDIGTGSGCIAISLAKNLPNAEVYAMDISEAAIEIAKANAKLNNVTVNFIQSDVLSMDQLNETYSLIVSNPPYVRELEKQEIRSNVLDNEPHIALFVSDQNPLVFYKKIAQLSKNSLTDEGVLYFEINQYLGIETKQMIESFGFESVQLQKDLYGNDRMICAKLRV